MSDGEPLIATGSQTIGPFFHVMPGCDAGHERVAAAEAPGEHLTLRVRVLDGEGTPVPDALIELCQANMAGTASRGSCGFGRRGTDTDGWATFETIRPGGSDGGAAVHAPHIDVLIFARGLLRHLYTRVYFDVDSTVSADPILQLVPEARRGTLMARRLDDGAWEFVIRLQGQDETVFFDL